ncbi:hypothetical protein B0H19DRAFT_1371469 [Mycena capillaripes]|nr:hypothetical protein B0H19DRAFT_1371469 [Mycena capillaripes]
MSQPRAHQIRLAPCVTPLDPRSVVYHPLRSPCPASPLRMLCVGHHLPPRRHGTNQTDPFRSTPQGPGHISPCVRHHLPPPPKPCAPRAVDDAATLRGTSHPTLSTVGTAPILADAIHAPPRGRCDHEQLHGPRAMAHLSLQTVAYLPLPTDELAISNENVVQTPNVAVPGNEKKRRDTQREYDRAAPTRQRLVRVLVRRESPICPPS